MNMSLCCVCVSFSVPPLILLGAFDRLRCVIYFYFIFFHFFLWFALLLFGVVSGLQFKLAWIHHLLFDPRWWARRALRKYGILCITECFIFTKPQQKDDYLFCFSFTLNGKYIIKSPAHFFSASAFFFSPFSIHFGRFKAICISFLCCALPVRNMCKLKRLQIDTQQI